ncbi:MAG TPA: DNA recombination protein RmuC, partial [Longimicrobium sp.]|nr:DNA recombination protein RmuC [Longimicrobium sp.]
MTQPWTLLIVLLLLVCVALQVMLLLRKPRAEAPALDARLDAFDRGQERVERALREELARAREEAGADAHRLRGEVRAELKEMNEAVTRIWSAQKNVLDGFAAQIGNLAVSNEQRMDLLRTGVEEKLERIRVENGEQLERMRHTVDEKLQGALEQRLGESFRLVSERLELVHRGLGEMQSLATGVGDLKRVLTNVKVRGTWGEVQLGALLEQVLTP